ncbi:MAG: hypothetical protein Q8O56_11615 [Solirubrobacteraceae bacterium]|nr:hypothetical protein [Solirubrobacteraceae bacterium]
MIGADLAASALVALDSGPERMHFATGALRMRRSSEQAFAVGDRSVTLGAGPIPTTTPGGSMSQLKYRAYPLLITAITVIAATGAGFRGN